MPEAMLKAVTRRFAVVGAGWSGCAAAAALHAAGQSVTWFESARTMGGRARAVAVDGRLVDNGQHILLGAYTECLSLMRRSGVDPDQAFLRLPLQMCYPGASGMQFVAARLPAPLHLIAALLRCAGLNRADKLALARFTSAARWMDWRLDRDCTVEEFLWRHDQTERLIRLLWRPLCLAALNTAPGEASAQVFLAVLRDSLGARRAASDMLIPRNDLGSLLPDAVCRMLESGNATVRRGARVRELIPCETGDWLLDAGTSAEDDRPFHGVVIATSAGEAARLLASHADVAALKTFEHEAIATCYLQYPQSVRLPRPFLALADDPASGHWGQFVFDRGQLDPAQQGLLAVVISAAGPAVVQGRKALLDSVAGQLSEAFGDDMLRQPEWSMAIVEKRATFSCRPNLKRPDNDIGVPGLWIAGDYTAGEYPATLEGAVRSGIQAAGLALAS